MKSIAERWSYGYTPRLHEVDLSPLVADLREKVAPPNWQIVLKRLILQAGGAVAHRGGRLALITGDAIGQVSSQTLQNLAVISQASPAMPVLRPLLGFNKEEILALARRIGIYELSAAVAEYCDLAPPKPNTRAALRDVLRDEARLDPDLLNKLVDDRRIHDLRRVDPEALASLLPEVDEVPAGATVIDLRSAAAFRGWHHPQALHLDFSHALAAYRSFARDRAYVLVCEVGLKSAHLAEKMREAGFDAFQLKGGIRGLMAARRGGGEDRRGAAGAGGAGLGTRSRRPVPCASSRRLVSSAVPSFLEARRQDFAEYFIGRRERQVQTMRQALSRRTELPVHETDRWFRILAESTSTAIFVYRADQVLYVNPACEMLTGYSSEELLAMLPWEIAAPDLQEALPRARRRPAERRSVGPQPLRGAHPHQGRPRALVRRHLGHHRARRGRAGGAPDRHRHHRAQAERGAAARHRRGDLLDHRRRLPALAGPPPRQRPRHGVRLRLRGGGRRGDPRPPARPLGDRRLQRAVRVRPPRHPLRARRRPRDQLPPLRHLEALPRRPLAGRHPHRELHRRAALRPRRPAARAHGGDEHRAGRRRRAGAVDPQDLRRPRRRRDRAQARRGGAGPGEGPRPGDPRLDRRRRHPHRRRGHRRLSQPGRRAAHRLDHGRGLRPAGGGHLQRRRRGDRQGRSPTPSSAASPRGG